MVPCMAWSIPGMRAGAPDLTARVAAAPVPVGAGSASFLGGGNLVICRGARHQDWAWKLRVYLSSPAAQLEMFKETGTLPAHHGAWIDPLLASDAYWTAFATQFESARPHPGAPEWPEIESALGRLVDAVLQDRVSPASAPEILEDHLASILERSVRHQPLAWLTIVLAGVLLGMV